MVNYFYIFVKYLKLQSIFREDIIRCFLHDVIYSFLYLLLFYLVFPTLVDSDICHYLYGFLIVYFWYARSFCKLPSFLYATQYGDILQAKSRSYPTEVRILRIESVFSITGNYHLTCTSNSDCNEINNICEERLHHCVCTPGYSYHPGTMSCVAGN